MECETGALPALSAPAIRWDGLASHDGTCTRDPNMNLIIQYGLLGLVLGLGLGLGFILYCRNWRPWHYRTCAHPQIGVTL